MADSRFTDARGLPLSAPSDDAAAQFEEIIDDIYYYRVGVQDRLDALISACPEFVLAHVLKGYSLMTEGTLETVPKARECLHDAETLPATPRERLHMDALRAWIAQNTRARAAAWQQILAEWPLDLLALRQYTGTLFWCGNKQHQAEILIRVGADWGPGTPGWAHFRSAQAFAMEEVGQYALAERYAREALELQRQDLWALHALAHVFEMQGRAAEGIKVLERAARFLNDYNPFRGHLWWHLALFLLSKSRFDDALALYDHVIYPDSSDFYLDIQNGVSLLARLEFQGIDVGPERWQRLAEGSLTHATQSTVWFTSMHHVIALARCGRYQEVQSVLDYLARAGVDSSQAALAHDLSAAAAEYYRGHPKKALKHMLALRQRRGELGASHAQQDIYDQISVMAALQAGDLERIRQLLKARLSTRIWDDASWQAYVEASRRVGEITDLPAILAELRWSQDSEPPPREDPLHKPMAADGSS